MDTGDSLRLYLAELALSHPLTAEEEAGLAERIQEGDSEARSKLIEANLRFVITIARKYQKRSVPLADLISAGNLGLITAAERYDPSHGVRFISYAVWWIRQAIRQAVKEHTRMVRLPMNRIDLLSRIATYTRGRQAAGEGPPSEEDIAQAMGISVERVRSILMWTQDVRSLDAGVGDHEEGALALSVIAQQESPDEKVMLTSLQGEIEAALSGLDPREREVIEMYYGLDGSSEMTLEDIGKRFGLTRERIRQIKQKALAKLRQPARARKLLPYADGF